MAFSIWPANSDETSTCSHGDRPTGGCIGHGWLHFRGTDLVGRKMGAATLLHESNAVPGRANRLLSRCADEVLVGMAPAAERFGKNHVEVTGTPVRDDFRGLDQHTCREQLGLPPDQAVVLVIGGSQGARGVNRLVTAASPKWREVSLLHICGATDEVEVLSLIHI